MTPAEEAWERLNSRLEAVELQRNNALTAQAITVGDLSIANIKLAEARRELDLIKKSRDELNAKLAALVLHQEA